jgi:hypothetical protein
VTATRNAPAQPRRRAFLGLSACLCFAGCAAPSSLRDCRIIGGAAEWNAGYFTAILLIENGSPRAVDLEEVYFELTTFDARKQVIERRAPIYVSAERPIERLDNRAVRLVKPDRHGNIRSAHVTMNDLGGRAISEWEVAPDHKVSDARPIVPAPRSY